MKLATLRNGGRDGRVVVVSRVLTRAADAGATAATLQTAPYDWARVAPRLEALAAQPLLSTRHICLKPETLFF